MSWMTRSFVSVIVQKDGRTTKSLVKLQRQDNFGTMFSLYE